ncbi:helicase-associated domain-containing protein [Paenibacillus sp. P26]|nr:helicase-associated domain-containing protein [Paenibacillus sp. P26]
MKIADFMARMPESLRRRLESGEAYAAWLAKGERLEQLLGDPAVMETVYNRMGRAERNVLSILIRHIGREPFDEAKLEKWTQHHMSGAETRIGLAGLLKLGIVFAFRKSWGEQIFLLPVDGLAIWRRLLFPELTVGPLPRKAGADEPVYRAETDLAGELFHALVYAANHGLKLTKNGTLHKKHIQKLTSGIRIDESLLTGLPVKFAYADVYPLKLAVVLDLLLRLEPLVPGQEEWQIRTDALSRWLKSPREDQSRILYSVWRSLMLPSEPWLQHAVILMERCSLQEGSTAAEPLQRLQEAALLPHAVDHEDQESVERRLQTQWLNPLAALGWVDQEAEGRYVWRLAIEGGESGEEEPGGIIVQPDFEILVPPDVPMAVCWELACLADPLSRDTVSIYKLSKDSVRRALENGRTAGELESFLTSHAMYGIPDNVSLALQQWTRPFGQTAFRQVTLLRCADAETARSIAKLPGASGYLGEPVGDQDFLISPEAIKPLYELLDRAGFMPVKPESEEGAGEAAIRSSARNRYRLL